MVKELLKRSGEKLYLHIFSEKLSDGVKGFLKNTLYAFGGFASAKVIMALVNILAGRKMGPAEYGHYSLIISIGMVLAIPCLAGISTAVVRFCALENDVEQKRRVISTGLIANLGTTAFVLIITLLASRYIAAFAGVGKYAIYAAIILTLFYVIQTFVTSILQGLTLIRARTKIEVVFSIIVLVVYLIGAHFSSTYKILYFPMIAAYAISIIAGYVIIRNYIGIYFDWAQYKKLMGYGIYAMIGAFAFAILTNVDRFFINQALGLKDVGIYRAYINSTIGLSLSIVMPFITVFFPYASKSTNRIAIYDKINKWIPYFVVVGLLSFFAAGYIVMRCYGKSYDLNILRLIMFSAASVLVFIYSIYDWLIASEGNIGVRISMNAVIISGTLNVVLNYIFTARFGIEGAVFSFIASYIVSLVYIVGHKKILEPKPV